MSGRLLSLLLAAACAAPREHPAEVRALLAAGSERVAPPPALHLETVETEPPEAGGEYLLGALDVLDVQVSGRADFGVRARNANDRLLGFRVQRDGNVHLPLVGALPAAGRTPLDVQVDLATRLKAYLENPFVTVDVLSYESQKFYVLGAVQRPGVFPVTGETTLLEGLGLAGGVRDGGDIEGAYVIRGPALLAVSLGDMLLRGDLSRNIRMRHGDLVYVPDGSRRQVYVLGEVRTPGAVPLPPGGLSLAAALAAAGGLDPVHADQNVIRVFRGSWQAPQVFTIGAEELYRFGHEIALRPGDRIHVAPRGVAKWSRTVTLLLPFLQSAVTGAAAAAAIAD